MIIECAVEGMGLAVVPEMYVENELSDGRLRLVFDRSQPSGEAIYACYPHSRISSPDVRVSGNGSPPRACGSELPGLGGARPSR